MSTSSFSQGFVFYIETPVEISGKPTKQEFQNEFDYLGSLVSTKRNKEEGNISYKNRINDTTVNPGDSLYEGTVNNLSRAFGLLRNSAIEINLVTDGYGEVLAPNPRVDFLANRVIFYSDWRPNGTETIDLEVPFYNEEDPCFYLSGLVSYVNSNSSYFSLTLDSDVRSNLHSTNLIRGSSFRRITGDLIEGSQRTKLSASNIIQDSLSFGDDKIFQTEVLSTPSAAGEYLVDYKNGIIKTFSIPSEFLDVSYNYNVFPMPVDYSLVKIYSLNDDDFKNKLFQKETLSSGEEVNSLPNTEGSEIIHQLHSETKYFWGK